MLPAVLVQGDKGDPLLCFRFLEKPQLRMFLAEFQARLVEPGPADSVLAIGDIGIGYEPQAASDPLSAQARATIAAATQPTDWAFSTSAWSNCLICVS